MFSIKNFKEELNTKFIGHNVVYLSETNSTNIDAWDKIDKSCNNGSLIITDNQLVGKGRRGNKWLSILNKSLTCSFILYPKIDFNQFGLLPLLTGVSIIRGIYSSTYIKPGLKWPNDIMLSRNKMGGILIETKSTSNGLAVVVGIGLNINEEKGDFPDVIKNNSTSLKIYTGENYMVEKVLAEILNEFENLYESNWVDIITDWSSYCIHNDSLISFNNDGKKYKGSFIGITNNGCAKILINDKIQIFPAGIVSI
tara:strand:- start:308 stop:1069 length:762 start_codon:yes stop_codon:yes gene_type:complete